jgi:triosephosphate isomerase
MRGRRIIIAGNWKMNTDRAQAVALAGQIADTVGAGTEIDVILAPPAPWLVPVHDAVHHSKVMTSAQNMHFEESGAFTGEISAAMIKDSGARFVILGHSERRHVFGESDEQINRKVAAALKAGLRPILCVGEKLDEREAGKTMDVVEHQLRRGLIGVPFERLREIVLAYEPVWAIGTGKVATPEQAEEVHAFLRQKLMQIYGSDLGQVISIQYGGSVKGSSAAGLLTKPNVDGLLVGGASLKGDEFIEIIRAGIAAAKS